MHKRVIVNFLSLCFGTGSQIFIQIVSIPIFLKYLDLKSYSIWLISSNLAQITGILDIGTITASQNRLAEMNESKQISQISKRILSVFYLFTFNNLFVITLITLLLPKINFGIPIVLVIYLLLNSYFQSLFGIIEACLRIENKVSLGLNIGNFARIFEFLSTLAGLHFFGSNLTQIAQLILIVKSFYFITCTIRIRKLLLTNITIQPIFNDFKETLRDGYPFFLVKFADTISLSGSVLIIQQHISAEMLVLFLSSRTFFRFSLQLANLVNFTIYYELSNAWSQKDSKAFLAWSRRNYLFTITIISLVIPFELKFGSTFFAKWTHDKLHISNSLLFAGILYAAVLTLSQSQKIPFHASNNNNLVSIVQLLGSFAFLIALSLFGYFSRLPQIFYLLFSIEFINLIFIWKKSKNWNTFS